MRRDMPPHLDDLARTLPVTMPIKDAAAVLCMSLRSLQRLIARGRIRGVKSGPGRSARVLVTRGELLRWLAENST